MFLLELQKVMAVCLCATADDDIAETGSAVHVVT